MAMADAGEPLWKMFKVCDRVRLIAGKAAFTIPKPLILVIDSLFPNSMPVIVFMYLSLSPKKRFHPLMMEKEKKVSCYQVISIAKQVTFALAVAESAYEFEHRDLHNSNILIKKTSNKYVVFCLNGKSYQMECCGVMAFIIDNTFSRYKISECTCYFCSSSPVLLLLRLASIPRALQAIPVASE